MEQPQKMALFRELSVVASLLIEARTRLEKMGIEHLRAAELHSDISRAHAHCSDVRERIASQPSAD